MLSNFLSRFLTLCDPDPRFVLVWHSITELINSLAMCADCRLQALLFFSTVLIHNISNFMTCFRNILGQKTLKNTTKITQRNHENLWLLNQVIYTKSLLTVSSVVLFDNFFLACWFHFPLLVPSSNWSLVWQKCLQQTCVSHAFASCEALLGFKKILPDRLST